MGYDYYYDYGYGYDVSPYSYETSVISGITAIIFGVFCIAIFVLQIIGMWKVFTKAGEKGWKSIIPVYNLVTLFRISGLSPLLVLVYLASIIPIIGTIVSLVLSIFQSNKLAKAFGKGTGFTVGLVLLPPIFYMILGFGKSEYIKPAENE